LAVQPMLKLRAAALLKSSVNHGFLSLRMAAGMAQSG
jgi:hypothetical protein